MRRRAGARATWCASATVAMDARIWSGWGMSEIGAITATGPDDPDERVFETDGSALPGVRAARDRAGRDVARTRRRGAGCWSGRTACSAATSSGPDLRGLDAEGWFDTGDLARIDAAGYLRITGRCKDIIIRGGENIPVVEIENLLFAHPDVAEVAIVAMPDARLGERACAFVVPREGSVPTLAGLGEFLAQRGAATQYRPERLELVDALPRTPTGKIQKFRLREQLASGAAAAAPAPVEEVS